MTGSTAGSLAVVPVLIGPLQVLLTILPGLLLAVGSAVLSLARPRVALNLLKLLWKQKLAVALVVAGGAGVVYGGQWVAGRLGATAGTVERGSQDWPLFRGDARRLGWVVGDPAPARGGVNWVHRQKNEAFFSSPAVVGNRVYATSATLGFMGLGERGSVYCFDADTGAVVWQNAPPGYRPTFSSPVASGRYVVCGEGLHYTTDARLVCLDAADNGKVLWTFATRSHVECTPVIDGDRVYVGAGTDGYYALALAGDGAGGPKVLWHVPGGPQFQDCETALAAHDGKVYAGLGVGGSALVVLDGRDGRELARLALPYPVFSPPAIADGKLYVGMGNGDFVYGAAELADKEAARLQAAGRSDAEIAAARARLKKGGQVACVDLATVRIDWTVPTGDTILGAVAVHDGEAFCADRSGVVYSLSTAGKLLATWDSHAPIFASPAVTDRLVYVVNGAGLLFALDRRTLEPRWEFRVGSADPVGGQAPMFFSSPAIARGKVYVGSQFDGLVCAGEPSAEVRQALWPGRLGGPGAGGNPDGLPVPVLGAFLWQFPADQAGQTQDAVVAAPAAAADGRLIVPLARGPSAGLAALPLEASSQATPPPTWTVAEPAGVWHAPAVVGETVFAVTGRAGDAGRALLAVSTADGRPRWRRELPTGAGGALSADLGGLLVADRPDGLSRYTIAGERAWSVPTGAVTHAATASGSLAVVAVADPPALVAVDLPTGAELWRAGLQAPAVAPPVVLKTVIHLATGGGVEARSLLEGRPVAGWSLAGGPATADLVVTRDRIVYVNAAGDLVILDRADGAVRRRIGGAAPGTVPVVGRDRVLYAGRGGWMAVPLDGPGDPVQWLDTSWLGAITAPAVVAGQRVYVGMAGWGLVCIGGGS